MPFYMANRIARNTTTNKLIIAQIHPVLAD
jgi:hypothetical protein